MTDGINVDIDYRFRITSFRNVFNKIMRELRREINGFTKYTRSTNTEISKNPDLSIIEMD